MDFAYSIDEYVPASNTFYVMYTPRPSTGLLPRAQAVTVPEHVIIAEDLAGVHKVVIDQAPVWEWIREDEVTEDDHADFLQDLVGLHEVQSTPIARPDTNYEIERPDPSAPIQYNPGVQDNYYGNVPLSTAELTNIVQMKHKAIRREGFIVIYTYVSEHHQVFDPDVVGPPQDEQRVWIHMVHDEVTAKIAAITQSTDPLDLVFDAVNHLPPSLVL